MKTAICLLAVLMSGCAAQKPIAVTPPPPPAPQARMNTSPLIPSPLVSAVTVTPPNPAMESGKQLQFKSSVPVVWSSCASNAIDQNGLFTGPVVAKKTYFCIIGTSITDSTQYGAAYVRVDPPIVSCEVSLWSRLASNEYYALPKWVTALTWVQPADIVYNDKQGVINLTSVPPLFFPPLFEPNPLCDYVLVGGGVPPYTYSATGLPTGLTMSPSGLISGTPLLGVYLNVVLSATDAAGTTVKTLPRTWQICDGKTFCDGFGGIILPPQGAKLMTVPHIFVGGFEMLVVPPNPHDNARP